MISTIIQTINLSLLSTDDDLWGGGDKGESHNMVSGDRRLLLDNHCAAYCNGNKVIIRERVIERGSGHYYWSVMLCTALPTGHNNGKQAEISRKLYM